ncbi:ester cyclase [Jannaschia aquimarina]|uniref:SnoaL-like polyketide cyclase n=1 Tax=Jannaschia aquimarina TaxID=935700 RepID=A0A0D1DAF9_9RHOB|nr:ester cyclase [Jannaschia aquimarina]KIT16908.1 SnoaL-like polyketide cyclase [Jannaschia aquimarina]SNT11838.1 Predicted ester cyclase [Jannaschia aquimarina]
MADGAARIEIDRHDAKAALEALSEGDLDRLAPDATCDAAHPFGRLTGSDARRPWAELHAAFPDLERRDTIFVAGQNHSDDRITEWRAPRLVACLGSYLGTFDAPFAGIPPTGALATLDYGEAHWIEDGRIRASWLVWDLAGLMLRTGCWPLAHPLGAPGHWPGPRTQDGLRMAATPDDRAEALGTVLDMHAILNGYRNDSIKGIDMRHWHPDFTYWAGGAIGACRGIEGFRAHHQIPYRRAFPDAQGAGHFARLSDGPYAVTGGDVTMTHAGDEYLGLAPTGRRLRFRVMDFYRFGADGRIAENWLPNDTLGLMAQMGIDVLARLRHRRGQPRRDVF